MSPARELAERMNQRQYEWLRHNRRPWWIQRLAEPPPGAVRASHGLPLDGPVQRMVAEAAEAHRLLQAARGAWQKVVGPRLAEHTQVLEVAGAGSRTVIIRVDASAALYQLARDQGRLEGALARLVPGVRRIRWVLGAPSDQAAGAGPVR